MASTARADPRNFRLDFGYAWDRVALSDNTALDGRLVRFGFSVAINYFHFGAEVDDSWLEGTTKVDDSGIARSMMVPAGSPLTGTMVAPKAFVGLHTNGRLLTFAGELAGGVRDSSVSSDVANDFAGRKMEPLLEARSRADLMIAPAWSIAAVASTDLRVRNDVSLAVMLSSHL
jgi:hypothetical protein